MNYNLEHVSHQEQEAIKSRGRLSIVPALLGQRERCRVSQEARISTIQREMHSESKSAEALQSLSDFRVRTQSSLRTFLNFNNSLVCFMKGFF